MNLVNYTCSFPTVRTAICSSLGYCTAEYLKMPTALGASTAAIIDKIFEFFLPSETLSDVEQSKAINGTVTQVTGLGLGMAFADGLFPGSILTSSPSLVIPKLGCIAVTIKVVEFIASSKAAQLLTKFAPLPNASLIRHNLIRYPLQTIASIFALNVLHSNSCSIFRKDEREVVIFIFTCVTMGIVVTSDLLYPLFQKYLPFGGEISNREKAHASPIPKINSTTNTFINDELKL